MKKTADGTEEITVGTPEETAAEDLKETESPDDTAAKNKAAEDNKKGADSAKEDEKSGKSEKADVAIKDLVERAKLEAYVLSSVLCSIGAILYCMNTMTGAVTQAKGFEMDAIASAVIGGTLLTGGVGTILGSFFGVLITGTITTLVMTNGKLLSSWSNILTAALLCFFILLQSIFAYIKNRATR